MERCGSRLNRRQFVVGSAGVGLLAGCGRLPGQGQAPPKPVRIGWLASREARYREAFSLAMRDLGYLEGESFVVEARDSGEQLQRSADTAAYLAGLPVDLFLAQGTAAVLAVQQATSTIPIVMVISTDPVGEGHVETLARPGGTVTGLSAMTRELAGKRLELLKLAVPTLSHPAVLWWPADPAMPSIFAEVQTAARILGLSLQSLEVDGARDFAPSFAAAVQEGVDGLLVLPTGFIISARQAIVDLAAAHRLPAMYPYRDFVIDGGLMNYGPSFVAMFRRAAFYVDRILKGAKPADLPVEQPMTFDFVVNMKTAQALGITLPNEIMLQVTEFIQ